jgi:uncharacterized protein with NRDE domain
MCITLITTSHPDYPFILLNNRDEFLARPTARAQWWDDPHNNVIGGRDLQRPEKGTWLGITKDGRIVNLTNYREYEGPIAKDKSRGALTSAYVKQAFDSDEAFADYLVNEVGIHDVGGFTLLHGKLRSTKGDGKLPGLGIVSSHTTSAESVKRIVTKTGETTGLSNSHYGDLSWAKVVHGEQLLKQAVKANIDQGSDSQEHFINSLFDILSVDTLPRPQPGEDWPEYTKQLRNSIFIPLITGEPVKHTPADKIAQVEGTETPDHENVKVNDGIYGTQQQTVVLVSKKGRVTYVERTLYQRNMEPMPEGERDVRFEFDVEGWEQ